MVDRFLTWKCSKISTPSLPPPPNRNNTTTRRWRQSNIRLLPSSTWQAFVFASILMVGPRSIPVQNTKTNNYEKRQDGNERKKRGERERESERARERERARARAREFSVNLSPILTLFLLLTFWGTFTEIVLNVTSHLRTHWHTSQFPSLSVDEKRKRRKTRSVLNQKLQGRCNFQKCVPTDFTLF